MRLNWIWLLAFGLTANVTAAGHLVIEHAWIRTAPPGAMMLAGYATLRNDGDAPITVMGADSVDFADVSLHQSVEENGVERMRPLGNVEILPGASVEFAPGGKHFMLMRPKRELSAGDKVKIHISTNSGDGAEVEFAVRSDSP
jgi:copper(I)-binding protein